MDMIGVDEETMGRFRRRVNAATARGFERVCQEAGLPLPTGVRWAVRRRIYTIPNVFVPVSLVIGCDPPWPLGTIIRYKNSGAMYRYCGLLDGQEPWERINPAEETPVQVCAREGHVPTLGLRYDPARESLVADCTRCNAILMSFAGG